VWWAGGRSIEETPGAFEDKPSIESQPVQKMEHGAYASKGVVTQGAQAGAVEICIVETEKKEIP